MDERPNLHNNHLGRARLVTSLLHQAGIIESTVAQAAIPPDSRDDLQEQLAWLIFPGFARTLTDDRLRQLPRYLEACSIRILRARNNPGSDLRKLETLAPFWQRYLDRITDENPPRQDRLALSEYRWMIEEFRISLFAQELKTAFPVSPKRLDKCWERVNAPTNG